MFGIGLPEMILILALALIVVGPDKLPDLARSVAKGIMELKKTAEGLKDQLDKEGNPLEDIKPDLENAAQSFKSHLLDHPDNGKVDLFDAESDRSATDQASKAYAELKNSGIDPQDVPTHNLSDDEIDLTEENLTEVVNAKPSHQEDSRSGPDENPQNDNSKTSQ